MMARWRSILVASAALFLVGVTWFSLFISRWPVHFPGESRVEYAIRRLKTVDNHVPMPKGSDKWVQTIVSSGADGMTVLVEEVVAGGGEGTRFSPSPSDILTRFGEAGRIRLHSEFYRLKAESLLSDEDCLARQAEATRVVITLVRQWSDDTLLVEWTDLMARGNAVIKGMGPYLPEKVIRWRNMRNYEANRLWNIAISQWGQDSPALHDEMTEDEVEALQKWLNRRHTLQD